MTGATDTGSLTGADQTDGTRESMPNLHEPLSVLWLTPDKPADISVGRHRIADHLTSAGNAVTVRGTTVRTFAQSLWERGRYDVVIGTTRAGALAATVVSQVHGVPLVVDHVDPIRQFHETVSRPMAAVVEQLEAAAFRASDHTLYVYPEARERVQRHASAWTKTDLGVEYERFVDPTADALEAARSTVGTPNGSIALYVGGLEPIYNVSTMLEAVERLEGWSLLVLGEGSLSNEVASAAAESNSVSYYGTVPHEEVPGYVHLADVGVSLVDDPHTLKVLEYFAAGLPVVQRAGRAEERFGNLATYTDPTPPALASAIERAIKDKRAQERRAFARRFDWSEIATTYASAIESVRD